MNPWVCGGSCVEEDFENEIEHFLERRAPLWPSARSGCTGFGAFLREQKETNMLSTLENRAFVVDGC